MSTEPPSNEARPERRRPIDPDTYFNGQFPEKPVYLKPGTFICTDNEKEMMVATVGSGVLVTLHDPNLKLGAICYVMISPKLLAEFPHFEKAETSLRSKALEPVEKCITEMKHRGAGKHRIQMRLIGGGKMPYEGGNDAGTKNYIFVREYITRKGLTVLNEDLAGPYIRRVHFFPSTGRAVRMILRRASDFVAMQDIEKNFSH